jgi:hypothetical protein
MFPNLDLHNSRKQNTKGKDVDLASRAKGCVSATYPLPWISTFFVCSAGPRLGDGSRFHGNSAIATTQMQTLESAPRSTRQENFAGGTSPHGRQGSCRFFLGMMRHRVDGRALLRTSMPECRAVRRCEMECPKAGRRPSSWPSVPGLRGVQPSPAEGLALNKMEQKDEEESKSKHQDANLGKSRKTSSYKPSCLASPPTAAS